MKVVSIDIETTGIDCRKDQIVEFGAVLFDTASPEFITSIFHKSIVNTRIVGAPFAINMNIDKIMFAKSIDEKIEKLERNPVMNKDVKFLTTANALISREKEGAFVNDFLLWLKSMDAYVGHSINIAGKNAAGFDIPFCLNFFSGWGDSVRWKRRILDPAILYSLREDEMLPDLNKCLERAGFNSTVSHCAVDDAMDVAMLIYKYYNPQINIEDIYHRADEAKLALRKDIEFLKNYEV